MVDHDHDADKDKATLCDFRLKTPQKTITNNMTGGSKRHEQ